MGLNSSEFGFHAFRRSGATYAFECNVPVENIKVHGHWKSDAVYTYLQSTSKSSRKVSDMFQNTIS